MYIVIIIFELFYFKLSRRPLTCVLLPARSIMNSAVLCKLGGMGWLIRNCITELVYGLILHILKYIRSIYL